jgi:V/A-type H+-transporting ATPase subunit K
MLLLAVFAGVGIGLSAWLQGRAAAGAADAQAETGQGLANYFMAIGVVEVVAIFVTIFTYLTIDNFVITATVAQSRRNGGCRA